MMYLKRKLRDFFTDYRLRMCVFPRVVPKVLDMLNLKTGHLLLKLFH